MMKMKRPGGSWKTRQRASDSPTRAFGNGGKGINASPDASDGRSPRKRSGSDEEKPSIEMLGHHETLDDLSFANHADGMKAIQQQVVDTMEEAVQRRRLSSETDAMSEASEVSRDLGHGEAATPTTLRHRKPSRSQQQQQHHELNDREYDGHSGGSMNGDHLNGMPHGTEDGARRSSRVDEKSREINFMGDANKKQVYVQINAQVMEVDFNKKEFDVDAFVKFFWRHDYKANGHPEYLAGNKEIGNEKKLAGPGFWRNYHIFDSSSIQFPVDQKNMFHNTIKQEYKSDPLLAYDIFDEYGIVGVQYRVRTLLASNFNLRTYPLVNLSLPMSIGLRHRDWEICLAKPMFLQEPGLASSPHLGRLLLQTGTPFCTAVSDQLQEYIPRPPFIDVKKPKKPVFKIRVLFNGTAHWTHIILPMHLILSLMEFALFLPEDQLESKLSVALGVLFGAVGTMHTIAQRQELDLLPYATLLDNYVAHTFGLVWAVSVANFVLYYLHMAQVSSDVIWTVKICTAVVFFLFWALLFRVCHLVSQGNLNFLEFNPLIRWMFVSSYDQSEVANQEGRSFGRLMKSPKATANTAGSFSGFGKIKDALPDILAIEHEHSMVGQHRKGDLGKLNLMQESLSGSLKRLPWTPRFGRAKQGAGAAMPGGKPTWECQSDSGWVAYDAEISAMLESSYSGQLRIRFETRFKVKGVMAAEVWSDRVEYEIDWDTYEQVNLKSLKRRPIRRILGNLSKLHNSNEKVVATHAPQNTLSNGPPKDSEIERQRQFQAEAGSGQQAVVQEAPSLENTPQGTERRELGVQQAGESETRAPAVAGANGSSAAVVPVIP